MLHLAEIHNFYT